MIRRKKKKGFDRSKFKKGLRKRMKTGQQKMQGIEPTHLSLPEDIQMYMPKVGDHTIDILPYIAGKNDPMTEEGEPTYTCQYLVHKDVGPQKKWYICPEQFEKDCPVCEERRNLMEEGHDKDVWKHLYPRERNLYNVVSYDSREEEKKGVQVFDVSSFYMEENLLKIANKKTKKRSSKSKVKSVEPFVDFASPDNDGKVISFTIEPAKSKDAYPQYGGHAFEDRDYEISDDLLDSVYTLDDFLSIASYDEIKKAFKRSDDSEESDEEEDIDDDFEDSEDEEDNEEDIELEDLEEDEEEESEPDACEFGYEFGVDANDYDECEDDCDEETWRACLAKKEAAKAAKKKVRRKKRRR